jgi:hypothetical protein
MAGSAFSRVQGKCSAQVLLEIERFAQPLAGRRCIVIVQRWDNGRRRALGIAEHDLLLFSKEGGYRRYPAGCEIAF